ncbi:MAG: response regulator, partial [Planctomycetota bacterium]
SCLIPLELADPGDHAWNSVDDNGFAARPVAGQEEHGEVAAPDRIEFSERHRAGPDGASRRESGRPHRRLAVVDAGTEKENASIEETLEAIGMPVVRKTHFEERIGGTSRRNAIDSVVWVLAEPVSVDITTQIDARRDTVIRLHRVGQTFDERLAEREVTISQPVLPAELMNAVFHPRERKDTGKSATGPRASVRGKKLLLVDDSEVNRLVIGRQLASKGHVVTTANDGLQAVRMAEQNEYDAILMDVQMPEMDGIEATNRIRLRHRELDREPPPIIALTAHVTAEHERICKEAGMVGFVTKPVRFESLLRELEQLFPAKSPDGKGEKLRPENRTAPVQSPSSGDDRLVRPHSSAAKPPSPIVPPDDSIGPLESDIKQRLFKHCGGNSEIGISLCDAFLQEVPDLIARLRKNRTAPGSSELVRAAHTLKSCLKYVADDETVAAAAKLEADAKTDVVLDEERLDDLVKRSQNWMDRVRVLKEELAGS